MATESSLVLLHLSDPHFTDPDRGHYWNSQESTERDLSAPDRKGLLGRLLEDPMLAKAKPSLVVVSGDLLDKADPSGVPLALGFLSDLANKLGLTHDRFALVPGNHDVHRDPALGYRYFDEIYKGFYRDERPGFAGKPGHERADLFDFPDLNVTIAGFNSSEDLRGENPPGSVGDTQRGGMEAQLMAVAKRPLRIAVMHHHLEQPGYQVKRDTSVMNDPQTMRTWLRERGFSLVLHGHQHLDWQTTAEIDDWRLTIVAAGSLGVGSYARKAWELPLCYQIIVIWNAWEGLRVRREYDVRSRRWGEASSGGDGKNRPRQRLRLGSVSAQVEKSPRDSRRFLPAFDALLSATPDSHRGRARPHRDAAEKGNTIDLCKLCEDLCEILDLLRGKEWHDFAHAAKILLFRVVLDVPLSSNPAALPPIRLYANELESVPVTTYLYLAIVVARAQGAGSVDIQFDPRFGLVGTAGLSPGFSLSVAPTSKDATYEVEKVLWEEIRSDKTEAYKAECECTPIECQEHRMLGDLDKCNQHCRRFRLYAELEGRSANGRRLFGVIDSSPDDWPAWSEVAANITSVSLLRLGGKRIGSGPPDENKVHYALKTFFEKADGQQRKRASR